MVKTLSASLASFLLFGCISVFAASNTYTDLDSGFKLKSQPSWMEIGGKNFYGLANKPDKKDTSVNLICAFTAKEIEEETGKKFTTAEFLQKFKDLQVLERNGISPDKVNYIVFMPDPYEIKENNKLSLMPKELLDNSSISISTSKKGKQPYVYLHVVSKSDGETLKNLRRAIDMQVALTSQNDMLYAVVSAFPLPDLKAQKEKIEEATPFSKKKGRNELTGGNKEKINGYIASRKAFINGLSFFQPVKETEPYGFTDPLLGGKVALPENWAYVQVNDDTTYDKIPLKLTVSAPWNGVSEILTYRDELESAIDREDLSKFNFQKISEAAIFASSEAKDKNAFAELFDTPLLTQLVINRIIKEGLKHPSVKNIIDFKNLETKSDFTNSHGTVDLKGTGTVKSKYDFNVNANLMFTPQLFGMKTYISRDDKKISSDLEKIFDHISLKKK